MYFDSRVFDKPKSRSAYIKNILLVNLIVFSTIYLMGRLVKSSPSASIIQSGGSVGKIAGPSAYLADIGESMLTGQAPF